jgi:hypothetical protein
MHIWHEFPGNRLHTTNGPHYRKGDERQVRKITLAVAVLGTAVAPATLAATANAHAHTTTPKPVYCIPPAGAQITAQGALSNTLAAIGNDTPSALARAGGVTITTGASGKGQLAVSLYEPVTGIFGWRLPPLLLGYGAVTVPAAGCSDQLKISLNFLGGLVLRISRSVKLEVFSVFAPSGGARGQASGKLTLSGGSGFFSLFSFR